MPGTTSNSCTKDEDVVITGMSARLPECSTVEEFAEKLFAGVDLVTADDRRWPMGIYGLPERAGKLKNLQHFDAAFFGVHSKQAQVMDPQLRFLLEVSHEAIIDAGINPAELKGSNTGVFVGVSHGESDDYWTTYIDQVNRYAMTGCSLSMFPTRVSYAFDFKGPSIAINTACSSSMVALTQALASIRAGHCDAAIVATSHLCLKPSTSLHLHKLGLLQPEGKCKVFDASANGYVRSEGVVALLLQKRGVARRVYATVRNACTNNDGYKEESVIFPSGNMQRQLAEKTLREINVDPSEVVYFEAHGTGTKVGDSQEVNWIADLFCCGREEPLLVGSVKSNMGHAEPASGLCSIVKVLIAMENGVIPGNLHYQSPNPDIPALSDGRLKVVDKNTNWNGGLVALNSFGFGGTNAHVILESARLTTRRSRVSERISLPRLVLASGRTGTGARALLSLAARYAGQESQEQQEQQEGLLALLDHVHAAPVAGHSYRGYALLNTGAERPQTVLSELESAEPRPVWFVFSGMGSQWPGMARSLLRLPLFAAGIRRCAAALQPHGVDLLHVLTNAPDSAFDNVVNSFVSIAAVQVALVDLLHAVDIYPDGIVGHSVGEIGCAYADGTLTAEQAVLAAYWRGRSILDAKLEPGAMAAVGLSWEECARRCPADVFPACHNSADSVTVSGPVPAIEKFVAELQAQDIFARRVNSSGVAFHSKYIAKAAPQLRKSLEQIIPSPKPRSSKWISSSVPQERWDDEICRLSSAAYHVNNLVSPVLFAEALRCVPARALLLEVAPHALLQAVLRRALPQATHVPLVHRDAPDALEHLLAAIGKIYLAGGQPHPGKLYSPVALPVPRGVPGLASAVRWDHSVEWGVAYFTTGFAKQRAAVADLRSEILPESVKCNNIGLMNKQLSGSSTNIDLDVVQDVAHILGTNVSSESELVNFLEMGMDSLMSTDIQQTLKKNYNIKLSVNEIRKLTFAKLRELSVASSCLPVKQ